MVANDGYPERARSARYPDGVSPDVKLLLLFSGLHVIGLGLVAMLLVMFLRSDPVRPWSPPDDGGGGGGEGNDRPAPREPGGPDGGGIPLSHAVPARVRLREPVRLSERVPRPARRPAREPDRRPAPDRLPARR